MVNYRKLVAIGDLSGKTFAIRTFLKDELPEPDPNILDIAITDVEVAGTIMELAVWDTCDKERYKELRLNAYHNADVVLIFFSCYGQDTFRNIKAIWVPEVRKHGPKKVPILLVGVLSRQLRSFRHEESNDLIGREQIDCMVREVGAVGCVQCCADNKYNLDKVFETAVAATL
ncbi:hypothetical protein Zmor_020364 [Zophobas morio]|uniref:Uncharacterized protein n=1 Tax=Zophobas morio TaxID=2755281 RepID=A0AA38I3R9_9CUCU|nr:hypothetical protein Zmor_020364 [Zophobas morio]